MDLELIIFKTWSFFFYVASASLIMRISETQIWYVHIHCKKAQYKVLIYSYICGSRIVITILLLQHTERKTPVPPLCKLFPSFSLCYFEIQRARVNGVTLLRVLINEPRAPSSPYPTSFSPLDSTPSIFNHKEVSAPPPPQLSRLLLWPVIATYILVLLSSFVSLSILTIHLF